MKRILFLFIVLHICVGSSFADELRPAYIQLDQKTDTQWHLIWQASANSLLGREGQIQLPANCTALGEFNTRIDGSTVRREADLNCQGDLNAQTIGLAGLEYSNTDALVRIAPINSELITMRLTPERARVEIKSSETGFVSNVAWTYTVIGVEHIVFGFDHFLFVLSLVLLLSGWRRIAWAVTAFTLSHSVTLIGTTLGWFGLPQRPVEAIIALSIVFLAAEIIKARPGQLRLSERWPWLVAFSFGLLHGFGFAGALAEIGLPTNDRPLALLSFNVGVELGQLLIVFVALLVLNLLSKVAPQLVRSIKLICAYGIGVTATYWFIERLLPI